MTDFFEVGDEFSSYQSINQSIVIYIAHKRKASNALVRY